MKYLKQMLPYIAVYLLAFYGVPALLKDTGSAMLGLLVIMPLLAGATGLVYGLKNAFKPWQLLFPLVVGLIFLPTLWLYYNTTAWIYAPSYALLSLMGNGLGYALNRAIKARKPTPGK